MTYALYKCDVFIYDKPSYAQSILPHFSPQLGHLSNPTLPPTSSLSLSLVSYKVRRVKAKPLPPSHSLLEPLLSSPTFTLTSGLVRGPPRSVWLVTCGCPRANIWNRDLPRLNCHKTHSLSCRAGPPGRRRFPDVQFLSSSFSVHLCRVKTRRQSACTRAYVIDYYRDQIL